MAGYRNQPDHQTSYPSTYDQTYESRTYQTAAYGDSHYQEPLPRRSGSRASSTAPTDGPQQPLYNALNNAFDKSDTARGVDPDLIAQITAEVKKSVLDEIKLNGVSVAGLHQPAPAPLQAYVSQSPTSTSASYPSRNVHTPPSPKHTDYSGQSHGSASPDSLAYDPMFDGSGDTPTPRDHGGRNAPVDIPNDASRTRPAAASRMSYDFTPIEKMWQPLFDPQGLPTPRLGQFLRGLAVHLIDDYNPKKSLVIPPCKMLQFYNDVKLSDEIYPWQNIFGKMPCSSLTKIYRELRCEHHFVQENLAGVPIVPALTPRGFEAWMTVMIQAYPDTEYERLSKAVLDMPISNADDCKERFPKELPRRLFPNQENLQSQQRCAAILFAEGVGPLRRAPSFPPPPPMSHSNGPLPALERERSPYATKPADSRAVESDGEDDSPLSMPLERERKPYSSTPGGGKTYEDDRCQNMPPNSAQENHNRTQSTASQSQYRKYSQANDRRPRSPSFSSYGTRSDPNIMRSDPKVNYQPSRLYDSEEDNRRFSKNAEMKRNDWARRQAEDDSNPAAGGHQRRSTTGIDSSYDSPFDQYNIRPSNNTYDNRGGYEPRRY
ncbi:hypothetical protein K504DRAFT_382131 [Pleomassaria siparia CBS 279.74]|uniref:DUF7514 domain-containing protein n=1 Tax=Pleomassaria siparia CBS 279.74 TaxID=1314801 RepID=A0A6G1K735_9PLEO|nr:hypothetical protein K504DRAFT_382131 [Pleomassaria siparia CBS 279.74]